MASPNFDALNIRVSKLVGDAISTATTAGDKWSSGQRDNWLNAACRRMYDEAIANDDQNYLRGYINTESQTLSASVKTLSSWTGGVGRIFQAYNTTDEEIVRPRTNDLEQEILNGNNIYINSGTNAQYYTLNNATFKLHGGTATSAVQLTYAKLHTDLAANDAGGAGDFVFPSQYFERILEEAYVVAKAEGA